MNRIRTQLLATAAVIALSSVAYAADMPVKALPPAPITGWTGFYLGGSLGAAQLTGSANTVSSSAGGVGTMRACSGRPDYPSCSTTASGLTAGVQGGYDWQLNNVVLGVAADWSWTGLNSTNSGTSPLTGSFAFYQAKIDWLASFRGRIGWAWDNKTLFYGTGGLALAKVKSNDGMTGFVTYTSALNETKTGWVAGGGIEYKLTPHWSLLGEALYYDLGKSSVTTKSVGGPAATYQTDFTHKIFQTKLGMNYRF